MQYTCIASFPGLPCFLFYLFELKHSTLYHCWDPTEEEASSYQHQTWRVSSTSEPEKRRLHSDPSSWQGQIYSGHGQKWLWEEGHGPTVRHQHLPETPSRSGHIPWTMHECTVPLSEVVRSHPWSSLQPPSKLCWQNPTVLRTTKGAKTNNIHWTDRENSPTPAERTQICPHQWTCMELCSGWTCGQHWTCHQVGWSWSHRLSPTSETAMCPGSLAYSEASPHYQQGARPVTPSISPPSACNEHGHKHLTIDSACVEHCHLLSHLISVVTSGFLLCTMLAVQFVMSVATEEGWRMASEMFGINYSASDTVQVKYSYGRTGNTFHVNNSS